MAEPPATQPNPMGLGPPSEIGTPADSAESYATWRVNSDSAKSNFLNLGVLYKGVPGSLLIEILKMKMSLVSWPLQGEMQQGSDDVHLLQKQVNL